MQKWQIIYPVCEMYRVAVLLTFHNRKECTLRCLGSLFEANHSDVDFSVYACDDGSCDGTSDAIIEKFSSVHIVHGDGTLYWNRGMLKAWEAAVPNNYDYYLWLNDDTVVDMDFWREMLSCTRSFSIPAVVSGLILEVDTGKIIYGGTDENGNLIQPNGQARSIRNLNGNMVLVPRAIVKVIGLLDPRLHHDLGDVDYGYRVKAAGYPLLATRQPTGYGVANDYCRVRKWNVSLCARFKRLYSPLGADPRLIFYFKKKHFGSLNAIMSCSYLLLLNLLPDNLVRLIWGSKYVDA